MYVAGEMREGRDKIGMSASCLCTLGQALDFRKTISLSRSNTGLYSSSDGRHNKIACAHLVKLDLSQRQLPILDPALGYTLAQTADMLRLISSCQQQLGLVPL